VGPPAATDLVRLRADLRAAGLLLLAAAAACIVLAAALGHAGGAWAAWAAGTYVSWAVAFLILVRRRLLRATRGARPLPGATGEERLRPTRGRALWVLLLASLVAAAAALGATSLLAGIVAAAGSTALAAARDVGRAETRLGGAVYFDRRGRFRGAGPLDSRNLWLKAQGP
jgi:hypothetical protein